jgi:hypothetical protein
MKAALTHHQVALLDLETGHVGLERRAREMRWQGAQDRPTGHDQPAARAAR